jgi:hypothetical protein
MQYNNCYRKYATTLNIAPTETDPSPASVEGARSLVERFYAWNPRQVGVGGSAGGGSLTSLGSLQPKKIKRLLSSMKTFRNAKVKEAMDLYAGKFPTKKSKRPVYEVIGDCHRELQFTHRDGDCLECL